MLVVQSHWGLHSLPFTERTEFESFSCSESNDEALARMDYVVDHGRQACIVEGQAGSGKTLLSRLHARGIAERGHAGCWLNMRSASDISMRDQLAMHLGLPWSEQPTWERLGRRCHELILERGRLVITMDDADCAAPDALENLRAMLDRHGDEAAQITAILTARSATAGRLQGRFSELCDLRIELTPWSLDETSQFVRKSLTLAGGDPAIFDSQALQRIHQCSGGIPREICRLSRLTLLAAAGEGATAVDDNTVEAVAEELVAS